MKRAVTVQGSTPASTDVQRRPGNARWNGISPSRRIWSSYYAARRPKAQIALRLAGCWLPSGQRQSIVSYVGLSRIWQTWRRPLSSSPVLTYWGCRVPSCKLPCAAWRNPVLSNRSAGAQNQLGPVHRGGAGRRQTSRSGGDTRPRFHQFVRMQMHPGSRSGWTTVELG